MTDDGKAETEIDQAIRDGVERRRHGEDDRVRRLAAIFGDTGKVTDDGQDSAA